MYRQTIFLLEISNRIEISFPKRIAESSQAILCTKLSIDTCQQLPWPFKLKRILELTVYSVICLERVPTMWEYDLELWSPPLKNSRHLALIMVINGTKMNDPVAYSSFSILPTTSSYCDNTTFPFNLRPWKTIFL